MKVAIVGAGRVGTCVGVLLTRAGHRVVAVSGRGPTRDRALRFLPDARVLAPDRMLVAVRAIAPVAGIPPKSGVARFATPCAINSTLSCDIGTDPSDKLDR